MKLTRPHTLLVLIVCLLGMAAGLASTKLRRNSLNGKSIPSEAVGLPQQQNSLNSFYFNVAGLPIQIAAMTAQNTGGTTSLNYTITNTGNFTADGVDLAVFDFNPSGGLVKVQSWNVRTPLNAGASAALSLKLKYRAAANSSLILGVETIRRSVPTSNVTQVNFSELAKAIAETVVDSKEISTPEVKTIAGALEPFGAAYCSDGFSKAFRLSKTGDSKRLTSFTCDRTQRTWLFGFSGKNLLSQ